MFVNREQELHRLGLFLDEALAGRGQIVFVTGEAGLGKTALIQEFARRRQALHSTLLVAHGNCNAQTGLADPYLPFREILTPFYHRRSDTPSPQRLDVRRERRAPARGPGPFDPNSCRSGS